MICRGCLEEKEPIDFPIRKDRSNRLRPYCNNCSNSIVRKRYNVHKRTSPFKLKSTRAHARAKICNVPCDLTPEYLESLWTGLCPIFNIPIYLWEVSRSQDDAAELDRFIPNKGYVKGNVNFISRRANRMKNNITTTELRLLLEWMEKNENG